MIIIMYWIIFVFLFSLIIVTLILKDLFNNSKKENEQIKTSRIWQNVWFHMFKNKRWEKN
jgi:hypothetical protein